jgi:SAM-dependent methyltransferase
MDVREGFERTHDLDWDVSLRNPIYLQMYFAVNAARDFLSALPEDPRLVIYDFGCGTKPYANFCKNKEYIGIDIDKMNTQADIHASIDAVPASDNVADIVVSFFVLEHVENPHAVIKEKYRILKSGGALFMLVPLYWEEHEVPYDYFRFTRYSLHKILSEAGFSNIEIRPINAGWAILGMQLIRRIPRQLSVLVPIINYVFSKLSRREISKAAATGAPVYDVMTYAVNAVRETVISRVPE